MSHSTSDAHIVGKRWYLVSGDLSAFLKQSSAW